ncbi:MAG: LysR family transcriptional regulator [Planctomycetes bacterium]|nr:LysR family transcriptional regulator [Planctomycetota bacterium]
MDLHKLRGFYSVVKFKGFTSAARRLQLSQPAVSLQVRSLELELGIRLLDRASKQIVLTRQGEVLYEMAQRLFESEEDIDRLFRDPAQLEKARLTLATNQSVAAHLLPERLAVYTHQLPNVEITIHNMRTADIVEGVVEGSIDVGVVLIDPRHPALEGRAVIPYEMVLITPRDHPLEARRRVTLADIAAYPFISYTKDTETRRLIDQPFQKEKRKISIKMSFGSTDLIIKYVSLGYGIAIIHNLNIDEANRENLHVRPLSRYFGREHVYLIYRRGEVIPPAARAFIELF